MSTRNNKRLVGFLVIAMTIALSLLLVSVPSDTLVSLVGSDNVYIVMYVVAFLGSITTFASIPYPLIAIGLVAGGFSPILVGIASAAGASTADTCTFFAARYGRAALGDRMLSSFDTLHGYIQKRPKLLTPLLVMYGSVAPLSNDFAVISLSLMKYRFYQVIPPLAVGNIIYNISIAFLGIHAYQWITSFFV